MRLGGTGETGRSSKRDVARSMSPCKCGVTPQARGPAALRASACSHVCAFLPPTVLSYTIMGRSMRPMRDSEYFRDVFERSQRPQEPSLPVLPTAARLAHTKARDAVSLRHSPPDDDRVAVHHGHRLSGGPTSGEDTRQNRDSRVTPRCQIVRRSGKPWQSPHVTRLGTLIQGSSKQEVCTSRENFGDLLMFKELEEELGSKELRTLEELSHPNIIRVRQVFALQDCIFLGLEYFRFPLQEVLQVHLDMVEDQIQVIAKSVGGASAAAGLFGSR